MIVLTEKNKILFSIKTYENKDMRLPKRTELYFDRNLKIKAKVDFKRIAY